MDFAFKAFSNYKSEEVTSQSVDVPSLEIPSQQASRPTSHYVVAEKNGTPIRAFDKVPSVGAWLNKQIKLQYDSKKDFSPKRIIEGSDSVMWQVKERNGRLVDVAIFKLQNRIDVNPRGPNDYDMIYDEVVYQGVAYPIAISKKEYDHRDVLSKLSFITENIDCPPSYLKAVFIHALQNQTDVKSLVTPKRSGWYEYDNGGLIFGSSSSVYKPCLKECYAKDLQERKLVPTDRAIVDIAKDYSKALPKFWHYKLLIALRIASLLLYFFEKAGIKPDQLFVIEPTSPSAAKTAISLLKNKNYESLVTLNLKSASKAEVKEYVKNINDGVAVFWDDACIEDWKKHDGNVQLTVDDLQGTDGIEENSRHLTAIVSENPCNIKSNCPAFYISLTQYACIGIEHEKLQRLSGEFDSAIVQAIVNDPVNMIDLIDKAIAWANVEAHTVRNSENINTIKLIRGGLYLMENYNMVSPDEKKEIYKALKSNNEIDRDSTTAIINDFGAALNATLFTEIPVVSQYGSPYYVPGKMMAFEADGYINMESDVLDRLLMKTKTTHKPLKVLSACAEGKLLRSNNGFKRRLEVEVAPGETKTVNIYSFSTALLNSQNKEKLAELKNANIMLDPTELSPLNVIPMITNKSGTKIIGQSRNSDDNGNQCVCGDSRSGKSRYLVEQAVNTAKHGDQVVIFDHSGSFTEHELRNHLSEETIEKYISIHVIPKQGIPVNIANTGNCDTLPEKKQYLKGILAAAARELRDKHGKVLLKRIGEMLKDKNGMVCISDILDYLDENDDVQMAIREKLEGVFESLEGLPKSNQTWAEFLASQKKIVVISTGKDSVSKGAHIVDMLLASFYSWKQCVPDNSIAVVLDECQDLNLDTDGPVDIMVRKGAKQGIRVLLASQEFSASKDRLGKIIGNCGTFVFFRPKTDNLADIAKLTGIDISTLSSLELGQCVVYGLLYDKTAGKNRQFTAVGWTYKNPAPKAVMADESYLKINRFKFIKR